MLIQQCHSVSTPLSGQMFHQYRTPEVGSVNLVPQSLPSSVTPSESGYIMAINSFTSSSTSTSSGAAATSSSATSDSGAMSRTEHDAYCARTSILCEEPVSNRM